MAKNQIDSLPTTDKGWETWLRNQKTPDEGYAVSMGRSLSVRLTGSGAKNFSTRVRIKGLKNPRPVQLGSHPTVTVEEARRRVVKAHAEAKEGVDPSFERRQEGPGSTKIVTFNDLLDYYIADRKKEVLKGKFKQKSLDSELGALKEIRNKFGNNLLTSLKTKHFSEFFDDVVETHNKKAKHFNGRIYNIAKGATSRAYKLAYLKGHYEANPVMMIPPPGENVKRDRILHDDVHLPRKKKRPENGVIKPEIKNELGKFVARLRDYNVDKKLEAPTRHVLYISLIMGLRADEVCSLTWDALSLDSSPPTLDVFEGGKTNAATRTLPLPHQVVKIFRELKEISKNDIYIFPSRDADNIKPYLNPQSASRACKRRMDKLNFEDIHMHDLRRTAASGFKQLTSNERLAEKLAGHVGSSTLSLHYDQSQELTRMLIGIQEWADAVDAAVEKHICSEDNNNNL